MTNRVYKSTGFKTRAASDRAYAWGHRYEDQVKTYNPVMPRAQGPRKAVPLPPDLADKFFRDRNTIHAPSDLRDKVRDFKRKHGPAIERAKHIMENLAPGAAKFALKAGMHHLIDWGLDNLPIVSTAMKIADVLDLTISTFGVDTANQFVYRDGWHWVAGPIHAHLGDGYWIGLSSTYQPTQAAQFELTGQAGKAPGQYFPWQWFASETHHTALLQQHPTTTIPSSYHNSIQIARPIGGEIQSVGAVPNIKRQSAHWGLIGKPVNPNLLRWSMALPEVALQPRPALAEAVRADTRALEVYSGGGYVPPLAPTAMHRRLPPGARRKEGKFFGSSALVKTFRVLDAVSEASEIVDAVFEALPKAVQRRWSKGRPNRGMLDQAGQYGIDGADWKLQAIWHNFDKVDWEQAIKNIIANQLEDQLHGAYHKGTPGWVGGALDEQTKFAHKNLVQPLTDFIKGL